MLVTVIFSTLGQQTADDSPLQEHSAYMQTDTPTHLYHGVGIVEVLLSNLAARCVPVD
jgi:hypothetical protein